MTTSSNLIHSEPCTFYVIDGDGEFVPCLGVLYIMDGSCVSRIEHIGADDTAQMILCLKPRRLQLFGRDLAVDRVFEGADHKPVLIIRSNPDDLYALTADGARLRSERDRRDQLERAEVGGMTAAQALGLDRQMHLGECLGFCQ